ncbi:MAG: hypothetical protein HYV26_07300 [Candidatus Hydrogenedentes bacterium]|nr:hypothetical protein [Candidatus Hydrogenedentota bacterium]MBI3119678.1 hypothetical protein [Candidatus Hydrogenedentota bacterium]
MNKGAIIAVAVVVVAVLSLPLLASLKKGTSSGSPPAEGSAPAAASPAAPAAPPLLNVQNLVGTVWSVKGFQATFGPGGQLSVAGTPLGTVSGTWAVSGATVTVSALGQTYTLQVSGNQLLADGQPIQRIG